MPSRCQQRFAVDLGLRAALRKFQVFMPLLCVLLRLAARIGLRALPAGARVRAVVGLPMALSG